MILSLSAHDAYRLHGRITYQRVRLYERRRLHIRFLRWPELAQELYPWPSAHLLSVWEALDRRSFRMWMDALDKELAQYRSS